MNIGTKFPKKVFIGDREVSNVRVGSENATYQKYTTLGSFGSGSFFIRNVSAFNTNPELDNNFTPYELATFGATQTTNYMEIPVGNLPSFYTSIGCFNTPFSIDNYSSIGIIASSPDQTDSYAYLVAELYDNYFYNYVTYSDIPFNMGNNESLSIPWAYYPYIEISTSQFQFIGFQKYAYTPYPNKRLRFHYLVGLD